MYVVGTFYNRFDASSVVGACFVVIVDFATDEGCVITVRCTVDSGCFIVGGFVIGVSYVVGVSCIISAVHAVTLPMKADNWLSLLSHSRPASLYFDSAFFSSLGVAQVSFSAALTFLFIVCFCQPQQFGSQFDV